jgi:hypothetical protein
VFSQRGTIRPQDFALCNVLFNKVLASEYQAFSNPFNLSCDTELFLRLCLRGKVGVVKEWSSIYRVHSDNLLKSVNKNTDFIIGSLEALINPLLEAMRRGVDTNTIHKFVENSGLRKEILVTLLKTNVVDKQKAKQLFFRLHQQLESVPASILPPKVFFIFLMFVSRALTPLFVLRRRLLYILNTIRRSMFGNQIHFEPLHRNVYVIE